MRRAVKTSRYPSGRHLSAPTCTAPPRPARYPLLDRRLPYPRQIQDLGAPMGFIQAGAIDFFVPRGYGHVIANLRGTGGSGGTFGFFDAQERRDMHDLVEWAAAQPWCDGNVGMIGISYFAMTQLEAAVERPPHLKAIFPVARHRRSLRGGAPPRAVQLRRSSRRSSSMVGMTSGHGDELWRSTLFDVARHVLNPPALHREVRHHERRGVRHHPQGSRCKLPHDPHPWDDLWRTSPSSTSCATSSGTSVTWPAADRRRHPRLPRLRLAERAAAPARHVHRVASVVGQPLTCASALLGDFGLTWPWESLHVEALAWFDHWLKGHDTGILEGPPHPVLRCPAPTSGAPSEHGRRRSRPTAPCPACRRHARPTTRANRVSATTWCSARARIEPSPARSTAPSVLTWTSAPLSSDLDVVGDIELRLDAIGDRARHGVDA